MYKRQPQSAQTELNRVFDKQYTLTLTEEIEVRYRTETRTGTRTVTDPETGETSTETYEYEVEVPYNYYILNVKLTNRPINSFVSELLTAEQLEMGQIRCIVLLIVIRIKKSTRIITGTLVKV